MQDEAWRQQQNRLLTAQFGPREVESLAMNSVLPLALPEQEAPRPLGWVQERELHELQVKAFNETVERYAVAGWVCVCGWVQERELHELQVDFLAHGI